MGSELTPRDVGAGLRALREEAGLQQKDLAKRAGISPTNLSGYENGGDLYLSTLLRLLAAIECGFTDLDLAIRRLRGDRLVSVEDWRRSLESLRSEVERLRSEVDELRGAGV